MQSLIFAQHGCNDCHLVLMDSAPSQLWQRRVVTLTCALWWRRRRGGRRSWQPRPRETACLWRPATKTSSWQPGRGGASCINAWGRASSTPVSPLWGRLGQYECVRLRCEYSTEVQESGRHHERNPTLPISPSLSATFIEQETPEHPWLDYPPFFCLKWKENIYLNKCGNEKTKQ